MTAGPTCSVPEVDTKPLCECHGEPMHAAKRYTGGWRCAIPQRQAQARYSEKNYTKLYVAERIRDLSAERERVLNQLKEVSEGASI